MRRAFAGILLAEIAVLVVVLYGAWSFLGPGTITAALADAGDPEILGISAAEMNGEADILIKMRLGGASAIEGKISLHILKSTSVVWTSGDESLLIQLGDSEKRWTVPDLEPGSYTARVTLSWKNEIEQSFATFDV